MPRRVGAAIVWPLRLSFFFTYENPGKGLPATRHQELIAELEANFVKDCGWPLCG
jgi:hypothetical protein